MTTKKRLVKNCDYTKEVVEVIAKEIRKDEKYKECKIKTYGPFGLDNESSIFVKNSEGKIIGSLYVRDSYDEKPHSFVRRTNINLGTYPKGSIGEVNGFNYKTYPLPKENDKCVELVFAETER